MIEVSDDPREDSMALDWSKQGDEGMRVARGTDMTLEKIAKCRRTRQAYLTSRGSWTMSLRHKASTAAWTDSDLETMKIRRCVHDTNTPQGTDIPLLSPFDLFLNLNRCHTHTLHLLLILGR